MPEAAISNRKDMLLLLLYSPGKGDDFNEPVSGRTRLVKMLFLFKEEAIDEFRKGTEITEENFYSFFPWNFGPFSVEVFDDLTFFALRGFVDCKVSQEVTLSESAEEWAEWVSRTGIDESDEYVREYEEEEYALTERGVQYVRLMYDLLSDTQTRLLREFKKRTTRAPLRVLLRYVYENYPGMTEKSVIREQVLG